MMFASVDGIHLRLKQNTLGLSGGELRLLILPLVEELVEALRSKCQGVRGSAVLYP